MAGTRTRVARDRVVAPGTRLAVPSAMVKITMELPDVEVWRAIQLAALAAVTRHARRARPDVARRFAAAAVALERATLGGSAPVPLALGYRGQHRFRFPLQGGEPMFRSVPEPIGNRVEPEPITGAPTVRAVPRKEVACSQGGGRSGQA